MKLLALLFAGFAWAGGQKNTPTPLPLSLPVKSGQSALPALPDVKVQFHDFAAPQASLALTPITPVAPTVPASVAGGLQALEAARQAVLPQNGQAPEPARLGDVYDGGDAQAPQNGGGASAAPEEPHFDFSSLPVESQLRTTGWYGRKTRVVPWNQAYDGNGWLRFYEGLYKSLAKNAPAGYRQETPQGPVFHLGGHDVAQAILGVGRSMPEGEVNLIGRYGDVAEHVALWTRVEVDAGPRGKLSIMINPESTGSLERMSKAPKTGDALDAVQNNIFLKWNLVTLTPRGLELRPLDERSAQDIESRRLRLSTSRGPLTGYEAHYNLIVAYRALRETGKPWSFEPKTRRFLDETLARMPQGQLEEALALAADSPALSKGEGPQKGMERLLAFIRAEIGARAGGRAAHVARDMPGELGGSMEAGVPESLIALAKPLRTASQLEKIADLPAPAGPFKFALLGDAEPGRFWFSRLLFNVPGVFKRLLRRAHAEPVDFIVQLGDMVSRGTVKHYERFFGLLSTLKLVKPYLTVIGNHDRARPHGVNNARVYRTLFGASTDYHFTRGGVRFVTLDTSAGRATAEQLAWLDEALSFSGPKILFTHMPPGYLSEWVDVPGLKGVGGFNLGAARFQEIVERRKVARVYVGHIHAFAALEKNGVRYVLTGGGGSALFPAPVREKFHHYIVVEAGPDGFKEVVKRDDGSAFELKWRP